MMLESLM